MIVTPNPNFDPLKLYRLACCGVSSVEALLTAYDIPLPKVREIRTDGPVLTCCDNLTITPTSTVAIPEIGPNGSTGCISRHEYTFEVCISRCLSNWFGQEKVCEIETGGCKTILDCNAEAPWTQYTPCEKPPTQAHEHASIMAERFLLETNLANVWKCCLNDPELSECGDCTLDGVCTDLRFNNSIESSQGGCSTVIMNFTAVYP